MSDKIVDLIKYYPEFLQETHEYKAITDAQNPEFNLFLNRIKSVDNNLLPGTAELHGIEIYESWLNIKSNPYLDIEERRAKVLAKLNETLPYTEIRLQKMLAAIVGWGHFSYKREGPYVQVILDETCYNAIIPVMDMLERVLPLNLYYKVSYGMTRNSDLKVGAYIYFGQEITLNPYVENEFETETHNVYVSAHLSMEINKWQ